MNHIFYDTETSGADTRFDQVFQFAGIVTDSNFDEIAHIDIRCNRWAHIVPAPEALAVTNTDPFTLDTAIPPYEFACRVHDWMKKWSPAVFAGYNTLRFDEEIMRQTLWQALLDPYITTARGSARLDIMLMAQAICSLRPGILNVPLHAETGHPIYRLEILAEENGFSDHNAHDALGDVRATIYIAKLMRQRAPDLWARLLDDTDFKRVEYTIKSGPARLLTHFGAPEIHDVLYLASNPKNPKQHAVFDLSADPQPFLDLNGEELAKAIGEDGNFKIIRTIRANAQPTVFSCDEALAPPPTNPIDPVTLETRIAFIQAHPTFKVAIADALRIRFEQFPKKPWVETKIYEGFASWDDKSRMEAFRDVDDWAQRMAIGRTFDDKRLQILASRLVFQHAPEVMPEALRSKFEAAVIKNRILAKDKDLPWTTLESAKASLDNIGTSPLAPQICAWFAAFEQTTLDENRLMRGLPGEEI